MVEIDALYSDGFAIDLFPPLPGTQVLDLLGHIVNIQFDYQSQASFHAFLSYSSHSLSAKFSFSPNFRLTHYRPRVNLIGLELAFWVLTLLIHG
jgi:hypothetical protein